MTAAAFSPRQVALAIPWRLLIGLLAVGIAYHYSLTTLLRGLTQQTPLAYLSLVPFVALTLAWARVARGGLSANQHELRLDFTLGRLLGLALIAIAISIALLVPIDIRFWLYRADLASLPIFVAGLTILLYGVRRAWEFRFPIAFLFLAWPVPYLPLLGGGLQAFTDVTVGAISVVTTVIPVARSTGSEGIFILTHGSETFPLSIGSACSGVNSLVGFLLVGGALTYVVRGPLARRVVWLVSGLVLIWLLNLLRIMGILVAGSLFGESAAIDVLHPIAGLVVFNAGVFAMLLAVRPFGLRFVRLGGTPRPVEPADRRGRRVGPIILILMIVAPLAFVNSTYARYDPLTNGLAEPQLQAFNVHGTYLDGWRSTYIASYEHARPFFGQQSTWTRTAYNGLPQAALYTNVPVYVDVISTPDSSSLAAYGLDQCYRFHGYLIHSERQVDIVPGIQATVIDYHNPKLSVDWSALVWEVPYQQGDEIWYQRVVVFLANGREAEFAGRLDRVPGAESSPYRETDEFLATFARNLMQSQLREAQVASQPAGG